MTVDNFSTQLFGTCVIAVMTLSICNLCEVRLARDFEPSTDNQIACSQCLERSKAQRLGYIRLAALRRWAMVRNKLMIRTPIGVLPEELKSLF